MENRDTFLARLHEPPGNIAFSGMEIARIELAYDLAKYAHRAQDRKDGTRYFEHPRRVALRVIDEIRLYDMETIIAALLHDGFEDCPQYVTPLKVEALGGEGAARMVRFLSKVPKEGYAERLMQVADWKTLTVKLCDRTDNDADLDSPVVCGTFTKKQTLETRDIYLPIFERLVRIAPMPYKETIEAMAEALSRSVWARVAKHGY